MGEHDRRRGRVRAHGRGRDALAVLRAAARPEPPLRLRAGSGDQAAPADALELGEVPRRLRLRSSSSGRRYADLERGGPDGELQPLDRWLVERRRSSSRRPRPATSAGSRSTSRAPSTRSSTISRTGTSAAPGGASGTATRRPCGRSGSRSSRALRVIAPVMPFLAEHLWQALVRDVAEGAPASVFLAGWPEARRAGRGVARRGRGAAERRRARAPGALGVAGLKLRQPLRRHRRRGRAARRGARRRDRRGAAGEGGRVRARRCELRVKPNLPALGPKLGKELGAVRAALQAGEFEELGGGRFRVAGHELGPRRCSSSGPERRAGRSPPTPGSPSRSTRRSTRSSRSRAGSTS